MVTTREAASGGPTLDRPAAKLGALEVAEVVLRLLRGEPPRALSEELGVAEAIVTAWQADYIAAIDPGSEAYMALISHVRPRVMLSTAVRRFRITPRELEVLELALDGQGAAQIAASLHVSVSTVVGHLMRLRIKTRTHSSAAMIAKVLGW
ncbi:MAG TPA: helix-turn-helix domain-containing protein [Candidatus Acidoferrum sp.]|nr:helix-turn-helix domain-containing protein [Candidatus Acidoferrum sp.]